MTANELRIKFNNEFGLGEWPKSYEVDHETYANCCQDLFNWLYNNYEYNVYHIDKDQVFKSCEITIGPNNGLMFKNVELILVKK